MRLQNTVELREYGWSLDDMMEACLECTQIIQTFRAARTKRIAVLKVPLKGDRDDGTSGLMVIIGHDDGLTADDKVEILVNLKQEYQDEPLDFDDGDIEWILM